MGGGAKDSDQYYSVLGWWYERLKITEIDPSDREADDFVENQTPILIAGFLQHLEL